jgi:hypothetical protein
MRFKVLSPPSPASLFEWDFKAFDSQGLRGFRG